MKKGMKAALATTILAMGITIFPQVSLAAGPTVINANGDGTHTFYDQEEQAYVTPFKATDDGLEPVTQQEYIEDVENPDAVPEIESSSSEYVDNGPTEIGSEEPTIPMEQDYRWWKYTQSSAIKYYGDPIKVSASVDCTATHCTVTKQWNATVSKSYSVSGSTEIKAINTGGHLHLHPPYQIQVRTRSRLIKVRQVISHLSRTNGNLQVH